MKKTLMCATAAAAMASAGFVAQAEEGWYGRADVGAVVDGIVDHDAPDDVLNSLGGNSEPNSMYTGGVGFGYGFDNGFRLEAGLTHRTGGLDVSQGINGLINGVIPDDLVVTNADGLETSRVVYASQPTGNLQSWDLMLNGIYDFNRDGKFQPYLGAGIGGARVKAKASNLTGVVLNKLDDPTTISGQSPVNGFGDDDTGIAYQGLAGIGYKFSDRLTVDFGYKYFLVQDLDFSGTGFNGEAVNYETDYQDHSLTAGLRYAFGAPVVPPPPPPPP
ncbi:MAG: outer membrane beta-barrel protein, partial [Pseudomonadota bacterium]